MTMRVLQFPSILLASALLLAPALSQDRSAGVALLIGNANYQDASSPLLTAIGDARALADELRRQNFDVDLKENLGTDEMRRAVDAFMGKISSGATAFLYFGGYGVQASRQTFLLPVNAQISTEAAVRREGINLDATLAEIHRRGARIKIVLIDGARRNPYEARFRTSPSGLAPLLDTPTGTLVMYAAAPGKLAADGKGTTSVLVTEVVKEMRVPGRQAEEIFNRARIAVSRASNNEQVPWVATSLTEPYQLGQLPPPPRPVAPPPVAAAPAPIAPPPPPVVATRPPPPPPPPFIAAAPPPAAPAPPPVITPAPPPVVAPAPAARPDPEDEMRRDYQFADTVGTRKAWDDFLARHPSGRYADAARDKIARLAPAAPEPRPAAAPPAPPRPQVTVAPMAPNAPQPAPMVEGSDDPAVQELDRKIRQSPNDAILYYKRGQLYAQHGSFRRAIEDFDIVIRLAPRDADAWNNRCWSRAVVGDLQDALSDCNEANKLRPRFVQALDSRGFVNLKLNKPRDAIKDYDAALQVSARHASSLYGRGLAKVKSGDTTGGNRDMTEAKRIQPDIVDEFATYGLR
jgi:hypothetical protein